MRLRDRCLFALALWVSASSVAQGHIWLDKGIATGDHGDSAAYEGTSTALWGDLLVVGAPNLDKPACTSCIPPKPFVADAGGVQIYQRNAGGWVLAQTLYSEQPVTDARFGAAVAIWGDVIVVGEPDWTPPQYPEFINNGRALVFVRQPTSGRFVYKKFVYELGLTFDSFSTRPRPEYGASVDVAGGLDRQYAIAVGGPGVDCIGGVSSQGSIPDCGSVLVNRFVVTASVDIVDSPANENTWRISTEFMNGDAWPGNLGHDVSIERADDSSICSGAQFLVGSGSPGTRYRMPDDVTFVWAGVVAIHRICSTQSPAAQGDVHLDAANHGWIEGPAAVEGEAFGYSLDITRTPSGEVLLAAGSPVSQDDVGKVFVFRRDGNGQWNFLSAISDGFGEPDDFFGGSVSLLGTRVVVGAPGRHHVFSSQAESWGSAYVFERDAAEQNSWHQTDELSVEALNLDSGVAAAADWIAMGANNGHGATQTWQRGWTLELTAPQHGSIQVVLPVYPVSPGIACPPDCSLSFENGRHLNPSANADDGYAFFSWEGAGCDDVEANSCPITIDSDKSLTANFGVNVGNTRTLNISIVGGGGTVTVDAANGSDLSCPGMCDGIYPSGTTMTAQAIPGPGYELAGWTGACQATNSETCAFDLLTNVNLTATFQPMAGNHAVTVDFQGQGDGDVILLSSDPPYTCHGGSSLCSVSRPVDSQITLNACAKDGSEFVEWIGASCWGSGACEFSLDSDKQVSAVFEVSTVLFKNGFDHAVACGDTADQAAADYKH